MNFRFQVQNLAVAVSSIFFCVACQPLVFKDSDLPCQVPELAPVNVDNSAPLKVSVNVDGSGSMYGYVKDNSNTRYIETLKLIDTVLHVGKSSRSPEPTIEFYRVGETQTQSISSNQYQQARTGDFYTGLNDNFPKVSSHLDVAIVKPEEEEQLLILVTDLDQEGKDLNRLNKAIQTTYLNQAQEGQAVAVLGIKSEYNHTVYTIDKDVYPDFSYDTTGKDPEAYRPFYVVFIGPYQDITHYYEKMQNKNPELINAGEFSVFNPDALVKQIATLQNFPSKLPQDIFRPSSLQSNKVAVEVKSPPYDLLEIHSKIAEQNPKIDYTAPLSLLPHTPDLDPQSIATETEVFTYDPNAEKFIPAANSSIEKMINLNSWNLTDNQLQFTNTLDLKSFPSPGIYLLKVNAIAEKLSDESWWQEWDRISRTSDADGSKTYNLLNFMQNLKVTTTDLIEQPAIGHFCFAIQKN
ncbi:MAG: hypothetical protein AAF383_00715 [Cyanobacteria bacterium P01_A01_bin.83]